MLAQGNLLLSIIMKLKKEAQDKLFHIEADLYKELPGLNSLSLMQGIGGLPILYLQLYKNTRSRAYLKKTDAVLDKLIDILEREKASVTFCEGISGISYMLNYMQSQTAHNQDAVKELSHFLDRVMLNFYEQHHTAYDLDFLHGSAGMLVAWLNKKQSAKQARTEAKMLMKSYVGAVEVYLNGLTDAANEKKIVNCGMAHGLVSQLMVLSVYAERFKDHTYTPYLQRIVELISSVQYDSPDVSLSSFPAILNLSKAAPAAPYRVPLGWCYGDTVVSVGLAKAGEVLHNPQVVQQARAVAVRSIQRATDEQAIIYDASFCHGSSSIAHTYNKWKWHSSATCFDNAYEHWIKRTVDLCSFSDGIGGYKKFEGDKYSAEAGILDGAAGAALVLSDYVYNRQPNWDGVFLLS